ncbi:MAG: hypothetical protein Q9199_001546 [Rusavskia elegans]
MNIFKASEPKDETYVSSTRTDSIYVLGSNVRPIQSGEFASKDEEELAAQGKKQQTNRNFGFMGILGFSCMLMLTWEAMFTVFVYGLTDGGPAGLVYGYLFCWFGYFTVVASLAELASMAPTAGGQYHWVYLLSPPAWRNFLSYLTGWQSTIAWQATVASSSFLSGTIVQGMLVLAYPSYTFEAWHGTLLLYAVLVVALAFNTFLGKYLPLIESSILILHIVGIFVIMIPIVYLSPTKSSAHDVFVLFLDNGGYNNKGLAFFVGIIATIFSFAGADGAVHMCEEIQNASSVVPWAMVFSILVNGILGLAMVIFLLFCLGDIDKALESPTKYPFIEIFYQGVRNSKAGAIALVSLIEVLLIFCCISLMAASSRMMWAFARDKGLPGWQFLSRIEPRTKLPIFTLITTTFITLFIALINIGSTTALNAVLSLVVSGFLGSYIPPIVLILYHRLSPSHSQHLHFGPWRLGKWGAPINAFALLWTVIAMFFSFWPTSVPVAAQTMNWSCLLYGATTLFGVSFGRFFFWFHLLGRGANVVGA